jgi:hypothetical protein
MEIIHGVCHKDIKIKGRLIRFAALNRTGFVDKPTIARSVEESSYGRKHR